MVWVRVRVRFRVTVSVAVTVTVTVRGSAHHLPRYRVGGCSIAKLTKVVTAYAVSVRVSV